MVFSSLSLKLAMNLAVISFSLDEVNDIIYLFSYPLTHVDESNFLFLLKVFIYYVENSCKTSFPQTML